MKKILISIFIFLICLFSVNALLNDSLVAYYSLNDTLLDVSGNLSNTLINNSATYTANGKIGGGMTFNGASSNLTGARLDRLENTGAFTINLWFNQTTISNYDMLFAKATGTSGGYSANIFTYTDNRIYLDTNTVTNARGFFAYNTLVQANRWYMLTMVYNGSGANNTYKLKAYLNGTEIGLNYTGTIPTTAVNNTNNISIGSNYGELNSWFEGRIDEVAIWNRNLSPAEITQIYNNGVGLVIMNYTAPLPPPPIINLTSITLNNNSYFKDSIITINTTTFNTSTNGNINHTYNLYYNSNKSLINTYKFANNSLTGFASIPNLNDDTYLIYFNFTNGLASNSTLNLTFTKDTTAPTISNNINGTYYYYNISGFNSSCSDLTLVYCNIRVNNQVLPLNTTTFNFTQNGNFTYNITAKDYMNFTTNTSGIIFINPKFYVYFTDNVSTPITNFNISDSRYNETNYTSVFSRPIYDYGLGVSNFTFLKAEYIVTNFSLNFTNTSNINSTYSIPGAKIIINIYDIDDFNLLDTSNTTITFIGDSFNEIYTTSTGQFNISSLQMQEETYTIIFSNPNYETTSQSFNYDNQQIITINVYMTPTTTNSTSVADLLINVVDDYQTPLENINVYQYIWDNTQGLYVQSNIKQTDYNGETSFSVFLNTRVYNFCAEYDGVLYCKNDKIININTQSITIQIPTSQVIVNNQTNIYDIQMTHSLTNTTIGNYSSVTFTYSNPNQSGTNYSLNVYRLDNLQRVLVYSNSSLLHSGGLNVLVNLNTNSTYYVTSSMTMNNQVRILDSLYLLAHHNLLDDFETYGWNKFFIIILVAFVIAIALNKYIHNVYLAHIGLPALFLFMTYIFPNYISYESFAVVLVVNISAFLIISKRDDYNKDANFKTITKILASYFIFILSLYTILIEMDSKDLLDDYSQNVKNTINNENSTITQLISSSESNLNNVKSSATTSDWELLTGLFLWALKFLDVFFALVSAILNMGSIILSIMGVTNSLLVFIGNIVDFILLFVIVRLYFEDSK